MIPSISKNTLHRGLVIIGSGLLIASHFATSKTAERFEVVVAGALFALALLLRFHRSSLEENPRPHPINDWTIPLFVAGFVAGAGSRFATSPESEMAMMLTAIVLFCTVDFLPKHDMVASR